MTPRLEFFYDYASPYSYLADSQLPALARRAEAEIVYRPALLGALIVESKNQPPPSVPAKARYLPLDIQRWTRRYGLDFAPNPHFPVNSVKVLRGALVALEEGEFSAYHAALFRAMWSEAANLGDIEGIRAVLERAGLDAARYLERVGDPAIKAALHASTAEALERGAFGLPTFFVGDEIFFGNDRLDFVEEALVARSPSPEQRT